ncbi:MAG TPA: hypothetical protein VMF11_02890 [Candidatus Baltobacteraceae bacterium]|nr:hypothetical protein [Candidatus Baltobacteraceae bacterium]
MKLPYRAGDSFGLPLGNGSLVRARILACGRHTVDIAVADSVLRVSDEALVLQRWRCIDRGAPSPFEARVPRASRDDDGAKWTGAAHAERIVATRLGIALLELPPLAVRARAFAPEYPTVRSEGELAGMLAEQPDVRVLRIAARNLPLDARRLRGLPHLQVLDLSGVALHSIEALAALPLRALRLARIDATIDLHALDGRPLDVLSLEDLREVRGLDVLPRWVSLEQLELLGFWQLDLDAVMPLTLMPALMRAEVDIGGRRKNRELYRRANWAYPWPFETIALMTRGPAQARPPARSDEALR